MLPSAAGFLCAVPINTARLRLSLGLAHSVPPPAEAAPHNMPPGSGTNHSRDTDNLDSQVLWDSGQGRIRARYTQISIRNNLLVAQKYLYIQPTRTWPFGWSAFERSKLERSPGDITYGEITSLVTTF